MRNDKRKIEVKKIERKEENEKKGEKKKDEIAGKKGMRTQKND